MELGVYDRLLLLSILPKEADVTTIRLLRKLREELSFSEEEHKALKFGAPCVSCNKPEPEHFGDGHSYEAHPGRIVWKQNGARPKDVNIGEKVRDIIVDALKDLNAKRKLTEEHLSLYEFFVEGKDDASSQRKTGKAQKTKA